MCRKPAYVFYKYFIVLHRKDLDIYELARLLCQPYGINAILSLKTSIKGVCDEYDLNLI